MDAIVAACKCYLGIVGIMGAAVFIIERLPPPWGFRRPR